MNCVREGEYSFNLSNYAKDLLFINTKTEYIFKSMAQSSTNIQNNNDIIVDLEKKTELLTKGSSSYYNSLFKNLSIEKRQCKNPL